MAKLPVTLTDDFLQTLVRDPLSGLVELIDNALDADANTITVDIARSALRAPAIVTVTDDGTGMSAALTERTFARLGDSWKRHSQLGLNGRLRRGRKGRGRFAAFAIGRTVTWTTTSDSPDGGGLEQVVVTGRAEGKEEFDLQGPNVVIGQPRGTVVRITDLSDTAASRLDSQDTRSRLGRAYAPYLARQRSLRMTIDGLPLDPGHQRRDLRTLPLPEPLPAGAPATVTVIEWDAKTVVPRPVLVLTDEHGDAVLDLPVLPTAPFRYTAYLSWSAFTGHVNDLPLGENAPGIIGAVISAAIDTVSAWVVRRQQQERVALVELWKHEQSYPYRDAPADAVEEAERDLFDLVATTAAPALAAGDAASRRFSLALIREALRRDPAELTEILDKVLKLNAEDLARLRDLLRRTSLSNVIATSQLVAGRLDVIHTLTDMTTYARPVRGKLERPVHELAAANPWLFGDGWALAQSERGLTEVLKWHRSELGDAVVYDDEPVELDGHVARVDIIFARTVENARNSRERLVVEFKRPGLGIGSEQVTQIEKYAQKIVGDGRFNGQQIRWEFVVVGSSIDAFAAGKASSDGYIDNHFGPGQSTVPIRVLTWDTLLKTCEHRLAFVANALNLDAETDLASSIRDVHEQALPGDSSAA